MPQENCPDRCQTVRGAPVSTGVADAQTLHENALLFVISGSVEKLVDMMISVFSQQASALDSKERQAAVGPNHWNGNAPGRQ
jgi:hypothetical protein